MLRSKPREKTPAPSAWPGWRRQVLPIAVLWVAALAAYSNSFRAELVFDSQRAILADTRIQAATPQNLHEIWNEDYWAGTGSSALYRPFSTLTYLVNYAILGDGPQPSGYHGVNFAIHAANIALVYWLGLLLFQDWAPAFAFAAIWSLHPVLTESVTNIAGRPDLLGAFGVLAGLLCYVRGRAWLAGLAASAAIAVFSKESGAVLPAVMLLYDVAFPRKTPWPSRTLAYFAAAAPIAIFLAMRARVLAQVSSMVISFCDNPLLGADFWTARITAIKVLAKYLWLFLWPARLSADYSYNQVPLFGWKLTAPEDLEAVLAVLLWIAIAACAIRAFRRARPVFFCLAFFLGTLAPTSNLFLRIGSIMAERFLYLPAIGLAGCAVWIAQAAIRRWKPTPGAIAVAFAVVCLGLAARTYARNFDWQDERSLWTAAVQAAPASQKAHSNLAGLLLNDPHPDFPAATREVEQALGIVDNLPENLSVTSIYANAGKCYRLSGDLPKALAVLLRGRRVDEAWNQAFQERNRLDGKSVSAVGTPRLYLDLGRVYLSLGQPDKAIEALLAGRLIHPEPDFFEWIAQAYHALGQPDREVTTLFEGVVADNSQSGTASRIVDFYRETPSQTCALVNGSINLDCPEVHTRICAAAHNVVQMYQQMRDPDAAANVSRGAIRSLGCPAELSR